MADHATTADAATSAASAATADHANTAGSATTATTAIHLDGGTVDASSIAVDGTTVIDGNRVASVSQIQLGTNLSEWSLRVSGRGGNASDDLYWLGTIDPVDYDNAGLFIDVCSGSRYRDAGCSSTYVGFGSYTGNATVLPSENYTVELMNSSVGNGHTPIPIVTAFEGSPIGDRNLQVYARMGSQNAMHYYNAVFHVRAFGLASEFVPGDGSLVPESTVTLNP